MARIKQACKNHPQRLTSRRCYYCHAPICTECQQHIEHHLFCGYWCYLRWKTKQVSTKFKAIPHLTTIALIVLILLSNLILFFYFSHQLSDLKSKIPAPAPVSQKDSAWFKIDSVFRPVQNQISFAVAASGQISASLWQNGNLVQFSNVRNGYLNFTNVPLIYGENHFVLWAHKANGNTQLIDSLNISYRSARLEFLARPVSMVPVQEKLVVLTFDAGSSNKGADTLLSILRQKKLHCTLFLTGAFLKHYPQLVQQMLSDGHEIGNHTFNHPHFTTYAANHLHQLGKNTSREHVINQLTKTDSLFQQLTGRHMAPYWRAPFGEYNRQILRWAAEAGFKHIGWSPKCDALDWVKDSTSSLYRSSNQILQHFLKLEEEHGLNGRIILMHIATERQNDFAYLMLPALIDSLRHRGYRFVTVSKLLNARHLP